MKAKSWQPRGEIPAFGLYGEGTLLPDILHCERIYERAAVYDWVIAPHRHADLHQFFLIEDGRFHLTVDGESHDFAGPVLLSVPRQAVHGFTFAQGTRGYVVTLPVPEFRDAFGEGSALAGQFLRWSARAVAGAVQGVFAAIHDEHQSRRPFRSVMLKALAMQLACLVAQQPTGSKVVPPSRLAARMTAFDALVRANMRAHWKVRDYAAALSLTPVHLNRVVPEPRGARGDGDVGVSVRRTYAVS